MTNSEGRKRNEEKWLRDEVAIRSRAFFRTGQEAFTYHTSADFERRHDAEVALRRARTNLDNFLSGRRYRTPGGETADLGPDGTDKAART